MQFIAALVAGLISCATAFVGVNVVPMDGGPALAGQTVIVRDERVERIGPVAEVDVPIDARVVYGRGSWLVPGLIDMHVHIRAVDLPAYVANGITTVRDLAGLDSVLATRGRVERGELLGPRILVSSQLLCGPGYSNPPFTRPVATVSGAAVAVDEQLARGATSIKVYEELSPAVLPPAHASLPARMPATSCRPEHRCTKNWPSSPPPVSPTKRSSPRPPGPPVNTSAIQRSA